MKDFKRYLWLSQVNLFGWLIVSSLLASSVVFMNGGISNYGNHYSTVLFYTFAFTFDVAYTHLAARALLKLNNSFKHIVYYLHGLCVLLLLVYITTFPRRFGILYSDIHDKISIFLFAYELIFSIWLLCKRLSLDTIGYLLIMVGGSTIALLSALHILHLMFVGQFVGALGFALLLVLIFPKVVTTELKKLSKKNRSNNINM